MWCGMLAVSSADSHAAISGANIPTDNSVILFRFLIGYEHFMGSAESFAAAAGGGGVLL